MSQQPSPSDPLTIDESDDFGARAAKHLREDVVVWLTTVGTTGVPAPNPVWFSWDGASTIQVFTGSTTARLKHLAANPRVSLNFAGDGQGGDIVVLTGTAVVDPNAPAADAAPEYLAKYAAEIPRINLTPASFAASYSVPIVITLDHLRGH